MKVYLVSTGSYSDYGIRAVFADKALAEAHATEIDGNSVEEFELIEKPPSRVAVYYKGTGHHAHLGEPFEWRFTSWDYDADHWSQRPRVVEYGDRKQGLLVGGLDREAVRKAFDDRWAQRQAERKDLA